MQFAGCRLRVSPIAFEPGNFRLEILEKYRRLLGFLLCLSLFSHCLLLNIDFGLQDLQLGFSFVHLID